MNKSLLFLFYFLFLTIYNNAQNRHYFKCKKVNEVNVSQLPVDWQFSVVNIEHPAPNGNSLREKMWRKKQELAQRYPASDFPLGRTRSGNDTILKVINGFHDNQSSGIPSDNDIAISNDGIVMSVVNSNASIYDTRNGNNLLLRQSIYNFVNDPSLLNVNRFDPKVIYDPTADRFILIFLFGNLYQNSRIAVCFSQTNDPTQGWNAYLLSGNPLGNNTWSDYPVVGISKDDLFIGVNTFTNGSSNNSGFVEACFWQVGLQEGYDGDPNLETFYYNDILNGQDILFNITPIQGGSRPQEDMILLSNKATEVSSNIYYMIKVEGSASSGNPQMSTQTILSPTDYHLPTVARQPNNHTFDPVDSRVFGGFVENGKIQFVQSTRDPIDNNIGIYHGFIDNVWASPSIKVNIISDGYTDYGFPNIAYSGKDATHENAIINFNTSSPTDTAGCAAIYYKKDGTYSDKVQVVSGLNYVDRISGFYERWGDYSGIQRIYNDPCKAIMVGYYGLANRVNGIWIGELSHNECEETAPFVKEGLVFPNPTVDFVNVNFILEKEQNISLEVYNTQGQIVKVFYRNGVKAGENVASFSIEPLPSAVYVLHIRDADGNKILEEKFIVQ